MKIKDEKDMQLNEIEAWKKEHSKIFKSIIGDKEYIWRRIRRQEYAEIMALKDGDDVDERIYNRQVAISKLVILNYTVKELEIELDELAGLATTISEEVLDKSGFNLVATVEL